MRLSRRVFLGALGRRASVGCSVVVVVVVEALEGERALLEVSERAEALLAEEAPVEGVVEVLDWAEPKDSADVNPGRERNRGGLTGTKLWRPNETLAAVT